MKDINKLILSLKNIKGIGDVAVKKILKNEGINYDNCDSYLDYEKFKTITFLEKKIENGKITDVEWNRAKLHADRIIKDCKENGIDIISIYDPAYPDNLKCLSKQPLILYVKGNLEILNTEKSVAIIGTRKPTVAGRKMATAFGRKLGKDGYVIVSGLAIGCDSFGHEGALEADAPTIAILAHGLDQPVYPKANRKLADKILEQGGALVSEYEPGKELLPQYLAARDAWQSGMSDGVIAVETGEKGGTLHAINHALKNNRPLGMLDFSAMPNKSGFIPGGNQKYISSKEAYGLFSKESADEFKKIMQSNHTKRMQELDDWTKKQDKLEDGYRGVEQRSLF